MSYSTPPGGPGSASTPYGQQPPPQQGGWQYQQGQQGQVYAPHVPVGPPGGWPIGPPGPPPPGSGGRSVRVVFGVLLVLAGTLALVGGGAVAMHAYSNSQQTIANPAYGPVLWRDEPADHLFPDHLGRKDGRAGDVTKPKNASWHRLGISPDTSCDKGLTATVKRAANRLGCKAVLRATYIDPTGNTVATVVLIVLPEGESKKKELEDFFLEQDGQAGTVNPLPVPGTLAAGWKADKRNGAGLSQTGGENLPYAIAATTGAADGRVAGDMPDADDLDVTSDRESWHGIAGNVVELFRIHIDELQKAGAES